MRTTRRARLSIVLACLAVLVTGVPASATTDPAPTTAPSAPTPRPAPPAPLPKVWSTIPSASYAAHDEPITYRNGCHASVYVVVPRPCVFGNPTGARTILLFGDSHAAHWHAAVLASAAAHGWRVLTLTKSSCPATNVSVRRYKMTIAYSECTTWRKAALAKLRAHAWGRIDVVVVSNWHFHQVLKGSTVLTGAARTAAWEAGMRSTLASLTVAAPQVVLLRDSPQLPGPATVAKACFARWLTAAWSHCGTTRSRALSASTWAAEVRAVASYPGRVFRYDLSSPVCTSTWCGPVVRPYLMFKDDNHFNQTFMRAHFAPLLRPILEAAVARIAG